MVFSPGRRDRGRWARLVPPLLLVLLASVGPATPAGRGAEGPDAGAAEQELVARLGALRAARGVPPLAFDARLNDIARDWSGRMAAAGRLSHIPDLANQVGLDWTRLGQNVGTGATAGAVHDQLVASPSHVANMVAPSFDAVGIGVASVGGRLWVTQVFVQGAPRTAPAPAPVSEVSPYSGPAWYRLAGAGGETYTFGAAAALPRVATAVPVVAGAPSAGGGAWLASADGAVHALGGAPFLGSLAGRALAQPVVGMAATPSGRGYWLVGRDGGIFAFGDAGFFGSTGAIRLNQPIVGMAATPSGRGYWFVAADGGVFAFGDAPFAGSAGGLRLNSPVVGMAATPAGGGYWLVARDGGIFAFGSAGFLGSTGAIRLNQPIVGMSASTTGQGYRFVAADGGIFSFGDAVFLGSVGGRLLSAPVTAMLAGG